MKLNKNILGNLFLIIIPSFTILIVAEVMLRVTMKNELAIVEDERSLTYNYDANLGWFPIKNSTGTFKGIKEISVKHNSRGFRDAEYIPGNSKRIMILGDSFVWGYDVEQEDRFTEVLEKELIETDVLNLGVSGYGTDQEWILLQQNYEFYKPEIVFLVFCTDNDKLDNRMNLRYKYFYKPYFEFSNDKLEKKGIPIPTGYRYFLLNQKFLANSYIVRLAVKTYYKVNNPAIFLHEDPTFTLIKNMREFSEEKGSIFFVALQKGDKELEGFLTEQGIEYVNVENDFLRGWHWNEKGHEFVAKKIEDFLIDRTTFQ